jgi:hypothetical protein
MAIRTDLTNSDISTSIVDNFEVDLNEYSNTLYDNSNDNQSTDVVIQENNNNDVVEISTGNKDRVAEVDTFDKNAYLAEFENGTLTELSSGADNNNVQQPKYSNHN